MPLPARTGISPEVAATSFTTIAVAEIPEMVYNSNAIENLTLTLKDTEDLLLRDIVRKDRYIREVFEAKNLSRIMESLLADPSRLSGSGSTGEARRRAFHGSRSAHT